MNKFIKRFKQGLHYLNPANLDADALCDFITCFASALICFILLIALFYTIANVQYCAGREEARAEIQRQEQARQAELEGNAEEDAARYNLYLQQQQAAFRRQQLRRRAGAHAVRIGRHL